MTTGGDANGGGEYATQIGFGWTNGVLLALGALYPELRAAAAVATPDLQAVVAALQQGRCRIRWVVHGQTG